MTNQSKMVWVGVGVVVLVLLGAILSWTGVLNLKGVVPVQKSPSEPAYAPKGQLTPSFPKELILDESAVVNNSYSIKYSSSSNQYAAEWSSTSGMVALFDKYHAYFTGNGWTITNEMTKYAGVRSVYAKSASAEANVTITEITKGSDVIVSYMEKK